MNKNINLELKTESNLGTVLIDVGHNTSLDVALIGIGVLTTAVLIADDISGYGVVDDSLIPIIWTVLVA